MTTTLGWQRCRSLAKRARSVVKESKRACSGLPA